MATPSPKAPSPPAAPKPRQAPIGSPQLPSPFVSQRQYVDNDRMIVKFVAIKKKEKISKAVQPIVTKVRNFRRKKVFRELGDKRKSEINNLIFLAENVVNGFNNYNEQEAESILDKIQRTLEYLEHLEEKAKKAKK
jgi:hypothetical protein